MDLLRRFALGEIDAFETLVRQFQGDIYAWIVRIVRDPGIAEDLREFHFQLFSVTR